MEISLLMWLSLLTSFHGFGVDARRTLIQRILIIGSTTLFKSYCQFCQTLKKEEKTTG